ncbi:MAG TPA: hypothetical protein VLH08_21320, partial [Acidobacteriota bacterium]|nr:hypothetical protein [Acidobacteriota bacterium]
AGSLYASTVEDVELVLISPAAGETLVVGQKVQVSYRANIPKDLDLTWCEQEAFLSIDGGRTFVRRITGQLSPRATSFDWIVPDLPTDNAVLNLRFGSDGGPGRSETSHIQSRNMFRIVPASVPVQSVDLGAISPKNAAAGDKIRISWNSTVKQVSRYEVHTSYNSGANFSLVGTTSKKRYSWMVPSGFIGHVTFKVVAIDRNGIRYESGINAQPDVVVK